MIRLYITKSQRVQEASTARGMRCCGAAEGGSERAPDGALRRDLRSGGPKSNRRKPQEPCSLPSPSWTSACATQALVTGTVTRDAGIPAGLSLAADFAARSRPRLRREAFLRGFSTFARA